MRPASEPFRVEKEIIQVHDDAYYDHHCNFFFCYASCTCSTSHTDTDIFWIDTPACVHCAACAWEEDRMHKVAYLSLTMLLVLIVNNHFPTGLHNAFRMHRRSRKLPTLYAHGKTSHNVRLGTNDLITMVPDWVLIKNCRWRKLPIRLIVEQSLLTGCLEALTCGCRLGIKRLTPAHPRWIGNHASEL